MAADTSTGNVLMAQRAWTKRNNPGQWACAVAGTIEEGETYDSNIVKEIEEEIGLTCLSLTTGPKQFVDDGTHKYFCQWYFASIDKDSAVLTPEEGAVEELRWLVPKELIADVSLNPDKYTPTAMETFKFLGVGEH